MEPTTTEILLDLLKRAAAARGVHEKELGKPDPDWPQWYADHMTRTLAEAGRGGVPASDQRALFRDAFSAVARAASPLTRSFQRSS